MVSFFLIPVVHALLPGGVVHWPGRCPTEAFAILSVIRFVLGVHFDSLC